MRGVNKVILMGNLGKDPDIQYLEGNIGRARLSVATTESHRDKTGIVRTTTEWHAVVLWRGLAEIAEKYLHKGSAVYIEGQLTTRHWEDKEGNKRYITEIIGNNLILLDKKDENNVPSNIDDKTNLTDKNNPSIM